MEFFWTEWTSQSRSSGQGPITEDQFGSIQMTEEVSEHVEMNYPNNPDSRYSAQPANDLLFPLEEEMRSAKTMSQ